MTSLVPVYLYWVPTGHLVSAFVFDIQPVGMSPYYIEVSACTLLAAQGLIANTSHRLFPSASKFTQPAVCAAKTGVVCVMLYASSIKYLHNPTGYLA